MNYGRTVTRLYEGTRAGANYGCAIQRYPRKHRAFDFVMVLIAILTVVVVFWTR